MQAIGIRADGRQGESCIPPFLRPYYGALLFCNLH